DHRYRTRGYLAWSPRPRAIDSCLVLLAFTNNRTNSCLLLTKLLADGFVTHSSLVQVYNLISDVLGQLFGLAHGGEVEGVKYDSLDRFLLYTSPVGIRCTLLGLMSNLCASWAHNWSLGARILAVCLGVRILIFCIKYKEKNTNTCYKMQFSVFFLLIFCFSLLKYTYHYNYRSHISLQVAKLAKSAGVQILIFPTVHAFKMLIFEE